MGTRCWIVLLEGRDEQDPFFLQIKEADRSVLEDQLPASVYDQHGRRVVEGQRLVQAASDSFLGWTVDPGDYLSQSADDVPPEACGFAIGLVCLQPGPVVALTMPRSEKSRLARSRRGADEHDGNQRVGGRSMERLVQSGTADQLVRQGGRCQLRRDQNPFPALTHGRILGPLAS